MMGNSLPHGRGSSANEHAPNRHTPNRRTTSRDRQGANSRGGQALLETVMYTPLLLLLLVGTIELGKIGYTYFALQKALYSIARLAGTQQGINLCDSTDPLLVQSINIVLTGTPSGDGPSLIQGLTADSILVTVERIDPTNGALGPCACSILGCDTASGGAPADFLVVSLVNGYTVSPVFPLFRVDPFPLRPQIRVPYGGS